MSNLIVLHACSSFCSLLFSKPLVLLDIPKLRELIDSCSNAKGGCCSAGKEAQERIAERKAFKVLDNLDKEAVRVLRGVLLEGSNSLGVNVVFEKINKNIVI